MQRRRELVELARVGRAEQRLIDNGNFLDAAHRAFEMEAVLVERALPAALGFVFQRIEPLGDVVGGGCAFFGISGHTRAEHAGDRRLLDDLAVVAAVQPVENIADRACIFDQLAQIGAGALLAGGKAQNRILEAGRDQIVLERALVLEVLLGLAAATL